MVSTESTSKNRHSQSHPGSYLTVAAILVVVVVVIVVEVLIHSIRNDNR